MYDKYRIIAFNNTAAAYLELGQNLDKHKYYKVIEKEEVVLKHENNNRKALLRCFICYLGLGEFDEAKHVLVRAAGGIELFEKIINNEIEEECDASLSIRSNWLWMQHVMSQRQLL